MVFLDRQPGMCPLSWGGCARDWPWLVVEEPADAFQPIGISYLVSVITRQHLQTCPCSPSLVVCF